MAKATRGDDTAGVAYPRQRKELVKLADEDQKELRALRINDQEMLLGAAKSCRIRAKRMLEILHEIKEPTLTAIGADGSKALVLLALHANLQIMKRVLAIFEKHFTEERDNIYYQSIPPLKDRVLILESRRQLFGTNWTVDKNGKPFLVPVEGFHDVNKRRQFYGLQPLRRPVILGAGAEKYPLGKGLAQESDQKPMTDEEYSAYAEYYLKDEL